MVMYRKSKTITCLFTAILCLVVSCTEDFSMEDDQLSIKKTGYSGNQLRIDGYYYEKHGDPEFLTIYLLYNNGVILHTGDGWEYSKLSEFEQIMQSPSHINKLKAMKNAWGVFRIEDNSIHFERWYPGTPPLKAYVRGGVILNDTTFTITESFRMKGDKKTEVSVKSETYHFRQFNHKPDSTNKFVQ